MTNRRFKTALEFVSAACLAATFAACTFPTDGARDDVGTFDAIDDTGTLDVVDVMVIDAAMDSEVGRDAQGDIGTPDVVRCPPDAGPSFRVCGGSCVNTASSGQHCGRCDNSCGLGTDCVAGSCNLRCSAGTVRCGTACIDPASNPEFCNADSMCMNFTPCMSGETCVNGSCRTNCAAGNIFCMGRCIDPTNSPQYCGASGNCTGSNAGTACSGAQVCSGGTCTNVCPPGTIACGGSCVDPLSSQMFCGASGNCMGPNAGRVCGPGEVCDNRMCTAVGCATGTVRCGDSCIDPLFNRTNCGARGDCTGPNRGVSCGPSQQCISGLCVFAPAPASYLATVVDDRPVTVPAAVSLRLSAPMLTTFYYTLDGSTPTPGATTTRVAMGQSVVLSGLGFNAMGAGECTRVRWFADYGPTIGREIAVNERVVCGQPLFSNLARPENRTESPFNVTAMDSVTLTTAGVTAGAVIIADRGARVDLAFRLRQWTPLGVGDRRALIYLEAPSRQQLFCHWVNNMRDETFTSSATPGLGFMAPTTPGRYAIRWGHSSGSGCGEPPSAEYRTIAVLIVR